ncbi:MAG: FadR family transcriptional regulator [Candidatus Bipolaricaulota bacterium]|nr:FadR family transcriptional regulator [Candidatus Bipolaricaulota bacterium]MDW8126163.1 FadR/GntR family transcriptional regulator [Candidatus Bipolaricaulota bacterium]
MARTKKGNASKKASLKAIPRSQKVVYAIVQRMREAMDQGKLRRGDQLPSESELCKELGVSRVAVREALKILEALGAVEIRHGSGTFIPEHPRPPVIDPLQFLLSLGDADPEHVKELRFMVELGFSRIAQRKITEAEIKKLEENLNALRKASEKKHVTLDLDLEFHYLILEATRNPLIIQLGKAILGLFHDSIEAGIREHPEAPVIHHTLIFEAMKSRDPQKLEEALLESYRYWQEHLRPTRKREGKDEK